MDKKVPDNEQAQREAIEKERARIEKIRAIGKAIRGVPTEFVDELIKYGTSLEEARIHLIEEQARISEKIHLHLQTSVPFGASETAAIKHETEKGPSLRPLENIIAELEKTSKEELTAIGLK